MTVKMMKVAAAVTVAMCLSTASAQQAISVNFGQHGTSGAPQPGGDTVKVQGRGVGTNRDEALKDAYRDAVERAVGLYVDAEVAANNDELVKDQVLTQSNAYITDYRELGETKLDGGLVQVRILATVKKQALAAKLSGVMPAQTASINSAALQNVHAQLVTKEKRAEDGAALLKNALDGINPIKSLLTARVRPETQKILTGEKAKIKYQPLPANQVMLRYLFEIKLDREKYFSELMPHLKKVLDQISITPPKEIRLTEASTRGHGDNRNKRLKKSLTLGGYEDEHGNFLGSDTSSGAYEMFSQKNGVPTYAWFDPHHVYYILWNGKNWGWQFGQGKSNYGLKTGGGVDNWIELNYKSFREIRGRGHTENGGVYFALITSLNSTCSSGKLTIYELDKSAIAVLDNWHDKVIGNDRQIKSTDYNIILLDKDGEEISAYPWQIPNDCLINIKFSDTHNSGKGPYPVPMVYATPFVGCFGESLLQWRDFILEKDQLAKIASIKIEPAE